MFLALLLAVAQPPPALAPGVLQDAVLSRAVFLVQRDACVLIEPDAPSVNAYGFNRKGDVALVKTEVSHCEPHASLPSLMRAVAISLALASKNEAPGSTLPAFDVKALDDAAFTITGKRLLLSSTPTDNAYDPATLRALFDALYAKPNETRIGLPMKKLYEATIKDALDRITTDIVLLTAKPNVLAAESKRLIDGSRSGKGAEGKDAWRMSLNKLVKSDDDAARIDPRLVGFVLRRHADGTLPVIVELLQRIKSDYR
jgi:hypothetical protein